MTEHIALTLKKAKFSQQRIRLETDDGEQLQGIVETLSEWTVTIRQPSGIFFIPIAEIKAVTYE